jgi:4-oxalocrotonate tautomerase
MPMVQITTVAGKTAEQKRKIAQRVTDALVEEAGVPREAVIVAFYDLPREDYAIGGTPFSQMVLPK